MTQSPPRRILMVGDSHVHAIQAALREAPPPAGIRIDALRIRSERIPGVTTEEAAAEAATLGEGDLVVAALRGNKGAIMGMIQHPRPFTVLLPQDDTAPDPALEVIPHRLLAQAFDDGMTREHGLQIRALASAGPARCLCLMGPAPKRDADHILRAADSMFRARGIETAGVSPAPLRLRLWQIEQDTLARFCAAEGLAFLPCPPGTRDAEGFLRREFWAPDATHANAAYGQRVIDQVLAWGGLAAAGPESGPESGPGSGPEPGPEPGPDPGPPAQGG